MAKYTLTDVKAQFLNRNLLLIIVIRIIDAISNQMISGVQGRIANSIGVTAMVIGFVATLNSAAKIVTRAPAGSIVDNYNKRNCFMMAYAVKIASIALFTFGNSTVAYISARVLQGVYGAFLGVVIPTIFAVTLKQKSMGLAYAVYGGLYTLGQNYGRPIGLSIYNSYGQVALGLAALSMTVVCIVMSQCLDYKKIENEILTQKAERGEEARPAKKSVLDGILVAAIPMAVVISIPMIAYTADMLYFGDYAAQIGIDPTTPLYLAGLLAFAMSFVTPVACDFIGAFWGTMLFYGCRIIGLVLIGMTNPAMIAAGILVNAFGECYDTPLMLMAFSTFDKSKMGAFNGTLYLIMDIISLIAGMVAGPLAEISYSVMYFGMAAITATGIVIFIIFTKTSKLYKASVSEKDGRAVI